MALRKYSKEWLEELCKESNSYAQVLIKAGRKPAGGNHSYLKAKINEYGIDVSHFLGKGWSKGLTAETDNRISPIRKYDYEEIFTENSNIPRRTVRKYILQDNLIDYCCAFCNNTGEWLNKKIALELDHINGINNDHRLENLRFLCPNCHATTETYAGNNN